jgi:hypothetical protein
MVAASQIDYFSRRGATAQRKITHQSSSLRRCAAA